MRSIDIGVEITTYVRIVLRRQGLSRHFAVNTGEVFVDHVGRVTKVSSPSSSTEKLNLNPEIRSPGYGEIVR